MDRKYQGLFRITLLTFITLLLGLFAGKSFFQGGEKQKADFHKSSVSEHGEQGFLSDRGLQVGAIIKPTSLVSLKTGEPVHLFTKGGDCSDNPGKFIVVIFFSERCPGCAKEVDFWNDVRKACEQRGIEFYLATFDSDAEVVRHFASLGGFEDMPILYDGQQARAAGVFDIDFVPTTYVFCPNGQVIGKGVGLYWTNIGKSLSRSEKLEKLMEWIGG